MATSFDLSDIPTAAAADLAAAISTLIARGRGLVLLNGVSEEDLDAVHSVLQERLAEQPSRVLATFMRFRHLVAVFESRRLREALLAQGFAVIAPAIAVGANMRLNGQRGFNPQCFLRALAAARADNVVEFATDRSGDFPGAVRLAA